MPGTFDIVEFHRKRNGDFGSHLDYFEEIESTNLTAEKMAKQGYPEGWVVLANLQTQGRGRKGNAWLSPPDVNLYFSVIVRPLLAHVQYLPFSAALSVLKCFEEHQIAADLKWPNDILVAGKKAAGILVQTAVEDQTLQYAVVGFGINVNWIEIPLDLKANVTSMKLEIGKDVSREAILANILFHFEKSYKTIPSLDWQAFCEELEKHSTYLRDCDVQVHQNGKTYTGKSAGLDSYGGLLVKIENNVKVFYAGEIEACRRK